MRTIVGFGNLLLFVLNVSALGAIAYKGQLWKSKSEEPSSIEEVLDLTPGQTQAIETQRRSFNANWVQIEDEMQDKRGRLLAALREEGSDPQMLWPLVDELSQLQAELEKQAVTHIFQEREVMTPSQQEQYFANLPPIPVATAKSVLTERILLLPNKYGFCINRITIRNQRTRWGSCSIKNNISLNIKLYHLPAELQDYVILHELVHTVHHNHSSAFWDKLKTILPMAKSLDRRLKKLGIPID